MQPNTLFLRLEGPLQAWGSHESRLAIRRTLDIPSKSGIAGILCAALGLARDKCSDYWLPTISSLKMGVRIDKPGVRWWDYHTVGAGQKMPIADFPASKLSGFSIPLSEEEAQLVRTGKSQTMLSRREYLCDASFLVALQGSCEIIDRLYSAISHPQWQLFLGRKSCVPSRAIDEHGIGAYDGLLSALASVPIADYPGNKQEAIKAWIDWVPEDDQVDIPDEVVLQYDVPVSFAPHVYHPRYIFPLDLPLQSLRTDTHIYPSRRWNPSRARADYGNRVYKEVRALRLIKDEGLCVLCKAPATTVQHISYEHAGGDERVEELRSMCRLCHDAATMLEYGAQMGIHRIDPSDPQWRDALLAKRGEIVRFRSREKRTELMQRKPKED